MSKTDLGHEVYFCDPLWERRTNERTDCRILAKVYWAGSFLCDCMIKNISSKGMMIYCEAGQWLPDAFEIRSPAFRDQVKVRRSWMRHSALGIEIVE